MQESVGHTEESTISLYESLKQYYFSSKFQSNFLYIFNENRENMKNLAFLAHNIALNMSVGHAEESAISLYESLKQYNFCSKVQSNFLYIFNENRENLKNLAFLARRHVRRSNEHKYLNILSILMKIRENKYDNCVRPSHTSLYFKTLAIK
jgi:hypothetical protein